MEACRVRNDQGPRPTADRPSMISDVVSLYPYFVHVSSSGGIKRHSLMASILHSSILDESDQEQEAVVQTELPEDGQVTTAPGPPAAVSILCCVALRCGARQHGASNGGMFLWSFSGRRITSSALWPKTTASVKSVLRLTWCSVRLVSRSMSKEASMSQSLQPFRSAHERFREASACKSNIAIALRVTLSLGSVRPSPMPLCEFFTGCQAVSQGSTKAT
ncbi:hypothetical protein C8035_v008953 [Colletotrichum spinosum]|uniref:Uncharacterized protein n=1 Tax=Colletotrichum spinosum TaxID=1347390 RepID=A0A4R8QJA7_9PEZI|nr:hypothetical protein C8035_v008953 [Colletotrichum spinosum]